MWNILLVGITGTFVIAYSGCGAPSDNVGRGNAWDAVDSTGRIVSLIPGGQHTLAVILHSTYSCAECFPQVDSVLELLGSEKPGLDVVVVTRPENGGRLTVDRSRALARRSMPGRLVYVEVLPKGHKDKWPPRNLQYGLFGRFDVRQTPALVLINQDSESVFLDYKTLFAHDLGGLKDSISAARRLIEKSP